ncbi:AAA domain-containing protein [bacterium]|nr:AAA domain-containing protein [bacterium]
MRAPFDKVIEAIRQRVVGMDAAIEQLLVCLLCGGHGLLEGMPGLAKTTLVKTLAETLEADFHRIQFTPDLLPSDVVGTDIYVPESGQFTFRAGPVFHNILLADEINRAPAKVQSALLEAMGEGQVTVGQSSYALPEVFMVLATQNPIEQEGTYPLPEAQLDRFLLHIPITYPSKEEEKRILSLDAKIAPNSKASPVLRLDQVLAARKQAAQTYMDDKIADYIVTLVHASRQPKALDANLAGWLRYGASPRATLALGRTARALAWLRGDEYVLPQHVKAMAPAVLRHRIGLSFEAQASGISADQAVARLLDIVAIV